jgi:hypothetical protein
MRGARRSVRKHVKNAGIESLPTAVALAPAVQFRDYFCVSVGVLPSAVLQNQDTAFGGALDPQIGIGLAVARKIGIAQVQHHLHRFHDIRLS